VLVSSQLPTKPSLSLPKYIYHSNERRLFPMWKNSTRDFCFHAQANAKTRTSRAAAQELKVSPAQALTKRCTIGRASSPSKHLRKPRCQQHPLRAESALHFIASATPLNHRSISLRPTVFTDTPDSNPSGGAQTSSPARLHVGLPSHLTRSCAVQHSTTISRPSAPLLLRLAC
jgi:hypothetical protein